MNVIQQYALIKEKIHQMRLLVQRGWDSHLKRGDFSESRLVNRFFDKVFKSGLSDPFHLDEETSSTLLFIHLCEELGKSSNSLGLIYLVNSLGYFIIQQSLFGRKGSELEIFGKDLDWKQKRFSFSLETVDLEISEGLISVKKFLNPVLADFFLFFQFSRTQKDLELCLVSRADVESFQNQRKFFADDFEVSDVLIDPQKIQKVILKDSERFYLNFKSLFRLGTTSLINANHFKMLKWLFQEEQRDESLNALIVKIYTRYRVLRAILHEGAYRHDRQQKIEKESNLARLHAIESFLLSLNELQMKAASLRSEDFGKIQEIWCDLSFFLRGEDYSQATVLSEEILSLLGEIKF